MHLGYQNDVILCIVPPLANERTTHLRFIFRDNKNDIIMINEEHLQCLLQAHDVWPYV